MNGIMSRWIKAFSQYSRDGLQLASAVVKHKRMNMKNEIKPLLLDQARQSNNAVATSLLQVDKQVGLVKYYGLSEFLKQRMQQSSSLSTMFSTSASSASGIDTSDSATEPKTKKATIAFMVTASMKEELNSRLGYEPEQIKKMTPLQASLILNHSVTPDVQEERLPELEADYERQREQDQEEELKRIAAATEAETPSTSPVEMTATPSELPSSSTALPPPPAATTTASPEATTTSEPSPFPSSNTINPPAFFSAASNNVLGQHDPSSNFGETWFEVTETNHASEDNNDDHDNANGNDNANDETTRVGLYIDEEEALLGQEVRQEIADRKGLKYTYEMHRISKEEL